jgi:hypothetical protein
MTHWLMAMLLLAAVALGSGPAAAQSNDALRTLQREVEALREGQQKLQKDVQELKDLLRTRGAAAPELPKDLTFALAGRIVKGAPTARVVLVDFTDYQ